MQRVTELNIGDWWCERRGDYPYQILDEEDLHAVRSALEQGELRPDHFWRARSPEAARP